MQGFGWAIAKALAEAGAEISLGVWVSGPGGAGERGTVVGQGLYAQRRLGSLAGTQLFCAGA